MLINVDLQVTEAHVAYEVYGFASFSAENHILRHTCINTQEQYSPTVSFL